MSEPVERTKEVPNEDRAFTGFIGRSRSQVEKAYAEFAKDRVIFHAWYELNPLMLPYSRHAIWVIYKKEDDK